MAVARLTLEPREMEEVRDALEKVEPQMNHALRELGRAVIRPGGTAELTAAEARAVAHLEGLSETAQTAVGWMEAALESAERAERERPTLRQRLGIDPA